MTNHTHYIPSYITDNDLLAAIKNHELFQPEFLGQGYSYSVGSDCYGGYVVAKKTIKKNKTIWGLISAKTEMHTSWTEGTMDCAFPGNSDNPEDYTPTKWIIESGSTKNGFPKFWFCDENGKKFNGRRCTYGWNGARAYRDPSW